ncbi:MAG: site-specific integrase [Clostridiales bacterium]|nr:site-specific integrase [Clostridiales bacterium]
MTTKDIKKLPKGITLRSDGYYLGRVSYFGERYSLYDRDLKTLQRRLNDLRYELEHGLYAKKSQLTIDDWFRTWIREYKSMTVKQGTVGVYEDTYRAYIKDALGRKKLKDLRPEQIQALYNKLNLDGYSHSTIELVSVVLGGLYKQAYKNQLIQKNPVPLATLPKAVDTVRQRVLTAEEQEIFLQIARKRKYSLAYELALSTGMRSGEVRGLRWEDIDFDKRLIHVTGTLVQNRYGFYRDLPKTKSSLRDIPMLDNVYQLLEKWREEQSERRNMLGADWRATEEFKDLVVATDMGAPLGKSYLNKGIKTIIKHIESETEKPFEYITFHGLRHTFATRCIENGMEPQVLKAIMGHSKLSMTMDLYAHVLPDAKLKEMEKIAGLFEK